MENNLNMEIINQLGAKIANLEIQLASLAVENKLLRELYEQPAQPESFEHPEEVENDED